MKSQTFSCAFLSTKINMSQKTRSFYFTRLLLCRFSVFLCSSADRQTGSAGLCSHYITTFLHTMMLDESCYEARSVLFGTES